MSTGRAQRPLRRRCGASRSQVRIERCASWMPRSRPPAASSRCTLVSTFPTSPSTSTSGDSASCTSSSTPRSRKSSPVSSSCAPRTPPARRVASSAGTRMTRPPTGRYRCSAASGCLCRLARSSTSAPALRSRRRGWCRAGRPTSRWPSTRRRGRERGGERSRSCPWASRCGAGLKSGRRRQASVSSLPSMSGPPTASSTGRR
mmetsp:Transcript_44682/g.129132  ORF Transcript_44682/g.129132 Transcript_44682/m.129132 type:complete len:203 (-) Transcript_44682:1711-2319(-)